MNNLPRRRPGSLFGDFFNEFDPFPSSPGRGHDHGFMLEPVGWMPPVEIEEREGELVLTMELPGLSRDDVDVSFEDGVLTIKGEKAEEREEANRDRKLHVFERQYGSFQRAFTLPRNIDGAKIAAEFRRGLLRVHLPKAEEDRVRGRKIEVGDSHPGVRPSEG